MTTSINFDNDWSFQLGDIARTNRLGGMDDYRPRVQWTKTGRHEPSLPTYDASTWKPIRLPHDWAIEGLPDPATDVNHGSRVGGIAWYRKIFQIPAASAGQRIWLEFEGVYRDCEVWVNGAFAGANRSGYIGFRVDLSELVRPGADNAVALRVDASEFEGWWYEGAGVYRHVHLLTAAPLHLVPDGIQLRTQLDGTAAQVEVTAEICQIDSESETIDVEVLLLDAPAIRPPARHAEWTSLETVRQRSTWYSPCRKLIYGPPIDPTCTRFPSA